MRQSPPLALKPASPTVPTQATRHALAFLCLYLLLVITTGVVFSIPAVEQSVHHVVGDRAWLFMVLRNPIPYLGTLAIVCYGFDPRRRAALRGVIGPLNLDVFVALALTAGAVTLLVMLGVWSFEWKRPGSQLADLVASMVRAHLWLPVSLHVVNATILVPLCEEVAFRLGLLQTLVARGFPAVAALWISSVAFGLVHWGALNEIDPWALRRVAFATAVAYVCGRLTLRDGGTVGRAIAVHAAINGTEAFFLVIAVVSYVRSHA